MPRASRKVASPQVVRVEDLRPLARRRVPRSVFDYLDGGAEGEVTLRENCRVFEDVTFRASDGVELNGWFYPAFTNSPRARLVVLRAGGLVKQLGEGLVLRAEIEAGCGVGRGSH